MAAGMIKREDITTVRERARIEEIVGEHVTLKPAGMDSYKGLCPFHDEKTPSFHVRPSVGMYHCFGCGEGGDVITFVQNLHHLSFVEAVEMLASQLGITLRYEEGGSRVRTEEPGKRQRLLDAHKVAEEFYAHQLGSPAAQDARQFLSGRGFSQQHAIDFGIGYSPSAWDELTRNLRSRGFTDAEIVASGLGMQGNRGVYDRFRGRLMWPIRDITGGTVGFGARRLDDSDKESPKYLNSPETPIYKKAQVLYGLEMAKKAIVEGRRVVIVEGYTDVMAAHVAGVRCAVATCGTAFGHEHAKIIRRLLGNQADPSASVMLSSGKPRGGEVIFTFDGDEAGKKAALRAYSEDQSFAAQTFVAVEASGMDPCDLRLAQGDAAVRALIDSRIPLFQFVLRTIIDAVDLRTAEGRVTALRQSAPVVASIRDFALRREYSRELAGWLGMDISEVYSAVKYAGQQARQAAAHGSQHASQYGGQQSAYRDEVRPGQQGGYASRGHTPGGGYASGAPGMDEAKRMAGEGDFSSESAGAGSSAIPVVSMTLPPANDPVTRLERQALEVLLQRPMDLLGSGVEELGAGSFTNPIHQAVFDAVRAAGAMTYYHNLFTSAYAHFKDENVAHAAAARRFGESIRDMAGDYLAGPFSELLVAPLPQAAGRDLSAYSRGVMAAMARMDIMRRLADQRMTLQRLNEDDPSYTEVFTELMRLEERRQRYSEYAQG